MSALAPPTALLGGFLFAPTPLLALLLWIVSMRGTASISLARAAALATFQLPRAPQLLLAARPPFLLGGHCVPTVQPFIYSFIIIIIIYIYFWHCRARSVHPEGEFHTQAGGGGAHGLLPLVDVPVFPWPSRAVSSLRISVAASSSPSLGRLRLSPSALGLVSSPPVAISAMTQFSSAVTLDPRVLPRVSARVRAVLFLRMRCPLSSALAAQHSTLLLTTVNPLY